MVKLNKSQIEEMNKLRKEKTQLELAHLFNCSLGTICYHTDEQQKQKRKNYSKSYFQNLSTERRKKINKSRRDYIRNYQNNKYKTNEEYRKKRIETSKNYQKKVKNGIQV